MEFINIDLMLSPAFVKEKSVIPTITQYAANYRVRVVFTDPNFRPERITLAINNGKILPLKTALLSGVKENIFDEDRYFYAYELKQYETEIFVENLRMTLTGYSENGSMIGAIVENVPMQKAVFSKFTPTYLEDNTVVSDLVDKINTLQDDVHDFLNFPTSLQDNINKILDGTLTVKKAERDGSGRNIVSTYATKADYLPLAGGTLTGTLYSNAATPLFIGYNGKVGMRAMVANDPNHKGQINISNAWYDASHYGAQMSARNETTGKYNAIRVSHNGPEYFDESDTSHKIALFEEIPTNYVAFTSQNLTEAQKATVRSNIGAGANGFSGLYSDIQNKPVLDTNNTSSLSTNSSETLNGTIALHKVSKTGSYSDLNNKPFISDKTVTVQTNGADAGSFTLNSSESATVNIPVPTTLAELTDDSTHRLVTDYQKTSWTQKAAITTTSSLPGASSSNRFNIYCCNEEFYICIQVPDEGYSGGIIL